MTMFNPPDVKRHWHAGIDIVSEFIPIAMDKLGMKQNDWLICGPLNDLDMNAPRRMTWWINLRKLETNGSHKRQRFAIVVRFTYLELQFFSKDALYALTTQQVEEGLAKRNNNNDVDTGRERQIRRFDDVSSENPAIIGRLAQDCDKFSRPAKTEDHSYGDWKMGD